MKIKFLLGLVAGLLLVGINGVVGATTFTESITFSSNNELSGNAGFDWSHIVPSDFGEMNSSNLEIISRRAVGEDDFVSIGVNQLGFLSANENGNNQVTTSFDLSGLGTDWSNGQVLDLSLLYNQGTGNNNKLTMVSSVFTLNYEKVEGSNDDGGQIHTPEPATMLLFGFGLLGLAGVIRKKQ